MPSWLLTIGSEKLSHLNSNELLYRSNMITCATLLCS